MFEVEDAKKYLQSDDVHVMISGLSCTISVTTERASKHAPTFFLALTHFISKCTFLAVCFVQAFAHDDCYDDNDEADDDSDDGDENAAAHRRSYRSPCIFLCLLLSFFASLAYGSESLVRMIFKMR